MELPKDVVSGSPLLSLLRVGTAVRVRNVLRSKGDDSQCCKERDDLFRGEIPGGSGREESHVSMIVTANLEAQWKWAVGEGNQPASMVGLPGDYLYCLIWQQRMSSFTATLAAAHIAEA